MALSKPFLDNRELSWLKFNERVLEEAEDSTVPLFERLNFVSIFCSNLDEFFMIRVGSLYDRSLLPSEREKTENKTNLNVTQQLEAISEKVRNLIPEKDRAYADIIEKFREMDIARHESTEFLSSDDEIFLRKFFTDEILPLLTPSIIDEKHPVQFLKNKEIYISAVLQPKDDISGDTVIGVLPGTAQGIFSRIVFLPSESDCVRFVLVENVILKYVGMVFTNYNVTEKNIFRITRNADIEVNEGLYDHDLDFRGVMEALVLKRKKLAPVRIEFGSYINKSVRDKILSKLNIDLSDNFVFVQSSPLDMSFVGLIENKLQHLECLFTENLKSQPSCHVKKGQSLFSQIDKGDILLSYPFETFSHFIDLLREAGDDPSVMSIKITLYRVARESKIVEALVNAAENGKYVMALVELRARFDEENNIGWSKTLEDAGVQVIYGLDDMKVHSKLLLITRKSGNTLRYYTQIGTGNYNERTSRLYTDLTLLTAVQDIGDDASVVFNHLCAGTVVEKNETNALWVAPLGLKSRAIELIENEMNFGNGGYIGLKLNSLTDKDIIDKLVEAGKRGVRIELLIRGICCIIAGVEGETDNIKVVSVVGRFLEHSRIYIFGTDERMKVYISSADFMTRNTERRVEVAAPVRVASMKRFIMDYFNRLVNNNIKARIQSSDGSYHKEYSAAAVDTQIEFFKDAYKNAECPVAEEEKTFLSKILALFKRN